MRRKIPPNLETALWAALVTEFTTFFDTSILVFHSSQETSSNHFWVLKFSIVTISHFRKTLIGILKRIHFAARSFKPLCSLVLLPPAI